MAVKRRPEAPRLSREASWLAHGKRAGRKAPGGAGRGGRVRNCQSHTWPGPQGARPGPPMSCLTLEGFLVRRKGPSPSPTPDQAFWEPHQASPSSSPYAAHIYSGVKLSKAPGAPKSHRHAAPGSAQAMGPEPPQLQEAGEVPTGIVNQISV